MIRAAFWGTTAALSAALVAASASARAGDISTREAEARFQEGLARVKSHDFEAARVSFAQAYAVLHRPQILWNLALAEEKTARVVEALQHFRAVADDASAGPIAPMPSATSTRSWRSQGTSRSKPRPERRSRLMAARCSPRLS